MIVCLAFMVCLLAFNQEGNILHVTAPLEKNNKTKDTADSVSDTDDPYLSQLLQQVLA